MQDTAFPLPARGTPINVRFSPTRVYLYRVRGPGTCQDCGVAGVWANTHLGNRALIDLWDPAMPNPETVDHHATCAVTQAARAAQKAQRAVEQPKGAPPAAPPEVSPPPAPAPTITELQCQALEAILEAAERGEDRWPLPPTGTAEGSDEPDACQTCLEEAVDEAEWHCALCGARDDPPEYPRSRAHPLWCEECADRLRQSSTLWDQVNEIAHRPDGTILEVEAIATELVRRFGFPADARDAILQAVNRCPIYISAKFGSSTVIRSEGPTADGS